MPTIIDYLGLSPGNLVQGVSLMPAVAASKPVRTNYSYLETLYPKTHLGWSELRGMRTDQWKLIVGPKPELYELTQDATEGHSVLAEHPADSDRLEKQIWEIAGPPDSLGKLEMPAVDPQTRQELQSLGYASAGSQHDVRIDMSGPDPKDRIHVLGTLEKAGDLMNKNRFREAIPLLEVAIRQDPTNPLLYQHLGICFQRLDQALKAVRLYQQAIENHADTDETHSELGELFMRMGAKVRAIQSMEEAARINPSDLQNLNNLATLYVEINKLEEAERVLQAILIQDSHHSAALNLFGILEIKRGHTDLAKMYFERAVSDNPDLAQAYMNLGILAQDAGETQQAISYFKKFLEKAEPKEHRDIIPKVKKTLSELQGRL
jgi:Tfp pilus assembly protein PilF